jgi:transcriptional regulator with XRE-family HTH domain
LNILSIKIDGIVQMSANYIERLEKVKQILRAKLNEILGNDRDEDAARFFNTSVSTFRRWKNGSQKPDTETLLLMAEKLGVSLDWFLLGKGNTSLDKENCLPLVARNKQGRYTGDILGKAVKGLQRLFGIDDAEIVKRSGLSDDEFTVLLDSAAKPDFEQMEALYLGLGVNPASFFEDDEYWAIIPNNQLLRAFAAVGHAWKMPTADMICDVFSTTDEEAEAFFAEWRESLSRGEDRVLKEAWFEVLKRDYEVIPEWILAPNAAPIAQKRLKQQAKESPSEREAAMERENAHLQELLASKEETIASQKETMAMQKQMLRQVYALPPWRGRDRAVFRPAACDGFPCPLWNEIERTGALAAPLPERKQDAFWNDLLPAWFAPLTLAPEEYEFSVTKAMVAVHLPGKSKLRICAVRYAIYGDRIEVTSMDIPEQGNVMLSSSIDEEGNLIEAVRTKTLPQRALEMLKKRLDKLLA